MKYMILLFDDQTGTEFDELSTETFDELMKVHTEFDTWCEEHGGDC